MMIDMLTLLLSLIVVGSAHPGPGHKEIQKQDVASARVIVLNDGRSCISGIQCSSGLCYKLQCVQCLQNDDCGVNQYCYTSDSGSMPYCRQLEPEGGVCYEDRMCLTGSCCDLECALSCNRTLPEGARCTTDSQCESHRCQDGICEGCSADSDCLQEEFCQDSAPGPLCLAQRLSGGVCDRDRMCSEGSCCDLVCSTECDRVLREGANCTSNHQCQGGVCSEGSCSGCQTDYDCDTDTEYCESASPGPLCLQRREAGDICDRDQMCVDPATCCDLQCAYTCDRILSEGANCTHNEQCEGEICRSGVCVGCKGDDDCEVDSFCELNGPLCMSRLPSGSACERDRMCDSGMECCDLTCVNSCSAILPRGSNCSSNSQCESGNCQSGSCLGCSDSADCAADEYCELSSPAMFCLPKKSSGGHCNEDVECTSDSCCDNECGTCIGTLRQDAACTRSDQCERGICRHGFCLGCKNDFDCESDQYCVQQSPGPLCMDKREKGELCHDDAWCLSDVCCGYRCRDECNNQYIGQPCQENSHCSTGNCTDGVCVCPQAFVQCGYTCILLHVFDESKIYDEADDYCQDAHGAYLGEIPSDPSLYSCFHLLSEGNAAWVYDYTSFRSVQNTTLSLLDEGSGSGDQGPSTRQQMKTRPKTFTDGLEYRKSIDNEAGSDSLLTEEGSGNVEEELRTNNNGNPKHTLRRRSRSRNTGKAGGKLRQLSRVLDFCDFITTSGVQSQPCLSTLPAAMCEIY